MKKIGIISDTHGTLIQSALNALSDVDCILHAGDIGSPQVVQALEQVAPTHAVRGNTDGGAWCENLPISDMLEIGDVSFYLLHDLLRLDIDPQSAGVAVVVHGHTHRPENRSQNGVIYFNPGSASQRRHGEPLSVGRIDIISGRVVPTIIILDR